MLDGIRKAIRREISIRQVKAHKGPIYLTLFVTNRCNLRCAHCFYHSEISGRKSEMSASDASRFLPSVKDRLASVVITGGEPTVHPELVEICEAINKLTKCPFIDLDTNGLDTKTVLSKINSILDRVNLKLNVQVSLDGFEATHDAIRNHKGAFSDSTATIKALTSLAKKRKALSVTVLTTVNALNVSDTLKLRKFVTDDLGARHNVSLVRGNAWGIAGLKDSDMSDFAPDDPKISLPPMEKIEELYDAIYPGSKELPHPRELQRKKLRLSIDILKKKKRLIECLAGYVDGVIYPDMSVALCESTSTIGNLKDFDYDFNKLWLSPEAEKMRTRTRKCCCIHACNILHSLKYAR